MMDKNKQIEEIAKVISDICPFYKEYGTCEQCNTAFDIEDEPCYWECMARGIIRNGYRRTSEVAEEIFAEIEKKISSMHYNANTTRKTVKVEELKEQVDWVLHEVVPQMIAELKKKYTEAHDGT